MSHLYQLCSEEWTEWHLTMYRLSLLDMVAVFFFTDAAARWNSLGFTDKAGISCCCQIVYVYGYVHIKCSSLLAHPQQISHGVLQNPGRSPIRRDVGRGADATNCGSRPHGAAAATLPGGGSSAKDQPGEMMWREHGGKESGL